jgi:diacylglycerol kinase family enzyme
VIGNAAGRRKALMIVNPHATTVSERLKNLVVYALQGRFDIEARTTEDQGHAIEIGQDAGEADYDLVIAFGGDGTINEVVNGLAGTDTPVAFLPGGSTNVVCRTLGIPNDVVDATERLLALADEPPVRRITLGRAGERYFLFSCGAGIDATVVEKVDARPDLKSKIGPWFYSWKAVTSYYRSYLRDPVMIEVRIGEDSARGLTALCQNSDPFTYFGDRPVHVCPPVEMADPELSMAVLKRANQADTIGLIPRLLSSRLDAADHPQVEVFPGLTYAELTSVSASPAGDLRKFPVQVDGDFIGRYERLTITAEPDALSIIA